MKNKILIIISITIVLCAFSKHALAFWVWTPETNKWENPKYAVKDTPELQLKYGQEFFDQGGYEEAIREYRKLIKHYPKARQAPEAQYYIGMSLEKMGKGFAAFKEYQVIMDKYPFSERSPDVVQRQYDIGVALMDGKRSKFFEAVSGSDYNILEIFDAVIKNAPYGLLAPQARYKKGLYLQEKKMYQEARDEFEKVANDYPDSEWAKAAKYQIAISDARRSPEAGREQKTTEIAVQELKDFVAKHPDAELSVNAKEEILLLRDKEAENNFQIAEFYEKQKKYDAAKVYYRDVADKYTDTTWAKKALLKIQDLGVKK